MFDNMLSWANSFSGLSEAETLADIYGLAFPLEIPELNNLSSIDHFSSRLDESRMAFRELRHKENIRLKYLSNNFEPSFKDTVGLVCDFDRAAGFTNSKSWEITMRGDLHHVKRTFDAKALHCDEGFGAKSRIYTYATNDPTLVVSHADHRDIFLRGPNPEILDVKLDDPSLQTKFNTAFEQCFDVFCEAARPVREKVMSVMTGVTLHSRPDLDRRNRKFFHAQTYDLISKSNSP